MHEEHKDIVTLTSSKSDDQECKNLSQLFSFIVKIAIFSSWYMLLIWCYAHIQLNIIYTEKKERKLARSENHGFMPTNQNPSSIHVMMCSWMSLTTRGHYYRSMVKKKAIKEQIH